MANNIPRLKEVIRPELLTKLNTKSIPNFLGKVDKNTNQQAEIWGGKIYQISPKDYLPITIQERFGARLIKKLKVPKNGMVVDLGCFLGEKLWQLPKRKNYLAIGVDIALPALKVARKVGYANHKFILADAQNLPFKHNSVDLVLAFDVIEHLTNPEKGFAEIARILKPGGKLLLHIPIKNNRWSLFWWKHKLFPEAAEKDYRDVGHILEKMLTTNQIKSYLKKNNLKIEKEIYYNSFLVHLFDRELFKLLAVLSNKLTGKNPQTKNSTSKVKAKNPNQLRNFYGKFVVPILEILSFPDCILSKFEIGNTYFVLAQKNK